MHAILASIGTDGDVFPYLGLGAQLLARGHRVTLASHAHYRAPAAENGFAFLELVTDDETQACLSNPDVWHPLKNAAFLAQWGARLIDRQYALLAGAASDPEAVLAAAPTVFAARIVQEKLSRPLATVVLQPWLFPSVSAPPTMPGGFTLPRWAPWPVGKLYWRLMDFALELILGRLFNPIRASLDLKPARRLLKWWFSPQLVLGLFPDWYAPPQADWPPHVQLTGFPLYDGRPRGDLSPDVLEFCLAGPPPVAFTFGTGMMHAERFFHAALEACRLFGGRGLFLTRHERQLPSPLPPFIRHCEFAPFQELFPHCAAVVHHGGVGTTARALAAGTPQLLLPLAFDQADNAMRVMRLGAGDWLPPRRWTGPLLAKALAALMTPEIRERCRAAAARFGGGDNLETAAEWIEDLAGREAYE